MPAYNELVRPYTRVPESSETGGLAADDKGKGKEVDTNTGAPNGLVPTPNPPILTPEEKRQRTGKHERGWKMFAQKVSGPWSSKKDTALQDIVKAPPRARLELKSFDRHVLGNFTLNEGQMDEQSLRALGVYPDGEKERKKDKDRKKNRHKQELLRAQANASSQPQTGAQTPGPQVRAPIPTQSAPLATAKPTPQLNGFPNGHTNHLQGSIPNGQPTEPGKAAGIGVVPPNAKINKVRKDRDDSSGYQAPPGNQQSGVQALNGTSVQAPPRPHKKRKVEGHLPNHTHQVPHTPSHPIQQATPTF